MMLVVVFVLVMTLWNQCSDVALPPLHHLLLLLAVLCMKIMKVKIMILRVVIMQMIGLADMLSGRKYHFFVLHLIRTGVCCVCTTPLLFSYEAVPLFQVIKRQLKGSYFEGS